MEELKKQMKILMKSMEDMKNSHNNNYRKFTAKMDHLESNVVSSIEETMRETV